MSGVWSFDNNTCILNNPSRGTDYHLWFGTQDGITPDSDYDDQTFEISTELSISDGNGQAGIIFRAQNLESNPIGPYYYLFSLRINTNNVKVTQFSLNQATQIVQSFPTLYYNQIYKLKIETFSNGFYNFYLDDSLIFNNIQLNQYKNGSIGIEADWVNAQFYDFEYIQT